MRPRITGLRARLVLAFVVVVVIVAGGTSGAVILVARNWIYSNAQSAAFTQFQDDATTVKEREYDQLTQQSANLSLPSNISLVIDGTQRVGSVDVAKLPAAFVQSVVGSSTIQFQRLSADRILLGTEVLVHARTEVGSANVQIYSIRPLEGVSSKLGTLRNIVIVTLAAGIAASIAVAVLLSTSVLRPLRRLDQAAAMAAQGDLSVRLPERGVPELAQVTSTFNDMIARHSETLADIRSSEERWRRFVADVSHELRSPLAAIVPVAEILHEDAERMPADLANAATLMGSEVAKLAVLIEDLMEMSRLDSGRAVLRREDTDVVQLVAHTLARRGWTDAVTVTGDASAMASVDRARIDVVIANIVGNALRHGGEPVTVEVRAAANLVRVTVTDQGPGIDETDIEHIFERFYKADTARGRSEGSGLGLALTAENVALHGGRVDVTSVPGETMFTIELPTTAP